MFFGHICCVGIQSLPLAHHFCLDNHGKGQARAKHHKNCAKRTCLDTMIGGHSKFFLGTGKFCKRDDNCCPALQSFEKRTCPARYCRCSSSQYSFWQVFSKRGKKASVRNLLLAGRFSKDDATYAIKTCLDAMIGGHSKFPLVTGKCCKKRWQIPFESFFS